MEINGPIRIGVLDKEDGSGRELHVTFTEEFAGLGLAAQTQQFQDYLAELDKAIAERNEDNPDRAGMLIVQQLCEQFYPVIKEGQMPMHDTILVEIGQEQAVSLTDLLA